MEISDEGNSTLVSLQFTGSLNFHVGLVSSNKSYLPASQFVTNIIRIFDIKKLRH